MENFKKLGIDNDILRVIDELGFENPTEIQAKTIPFVIEGKDVIGGSATGSGKTLAFGVGAIQKAHKGGGIQTLILAPTRELAEQIHKDLKLYSKYKKLSLCTIYGGVSINPQFKNLTKADIVIGTPGRILDHIQRGTIDLNFVNFFVLDEADRMLDMGFLDDVRDIMNKCPKEKQTLLFSATIDSEIKRLSSQFMNNPVKVSVEQYVDPKLLTQIYYNVRRNNKFSALVHLLKNEKPGLVMVFCNSRKYVDAVSNGLVANGIQATAIHGGLTQQRRKEVIDKFHTKNVFILVCTDVAARGLHIDGISHVYNYDLPNDPKQYVHRIGRTARAGSSGMVINLLSDNDHSYFARIKSDNDFEISRADLPHIQIVKDFNVQRSDTNFRTGSYGKSGAHRGNSSSNQRSFSRGQSNSRGRRPSQSNND